MFAVCVNFQNQGWGMDNFMPLMHQQATVYFLGHPLQPHRLK